MVQYFTVKPRYGVAAQIAQGDKAFIDPYQLLPAAMFLEEPKPQGATGFFFDSILLFFNFLNTYSTF